MRARPRAPGLAEPTGVSGGMGAVKCACVLAVHLRGRHCVIDSQQCKPHGLAACSLAVRPSTQPDTLPQHDLQGLACQPYSSQSQSAKGIGGAYSPRVKNCSGEAGFKKGGQAGSKARGACVAFCRQRGVAHMQGQRASSLLRAQGAAPWAQQARAQEKWGWAAGGTAVLLDSAARLARRCRS